MTDFLNSSDLGLIVPSRVESHLLCVEGVEISLAIKRDDLIHPLISGNKWRKLQYFLAQAALAEKDTLMSVGGAYSNHLLALAALAKSTGRQSIGYLRGEERREPNPYERWLSQLGMQLQYADRTQFRDKERLYQQMAAQHAHASLVPEGGDPLPDHRQVAALLDEQSMAYDHLLLSCGTGSMLKALARGMAERAMQTRLYGICAVQHPAFMQQLTLACRMHYANTLVVGNPAKTRFGKLHPSMLAMAKTCLEQTGIAPDPVYDSALLLYLLQCHQDGSIKAHEKVLWVHSGGCLGWAGYSSESHELFGL